MSPSKFRFAALSVVKHSYVPLGIAAHPRFEPVVVADDPDVPDWVHERNEQFARQFDIPYVRDVEKAIADSEIIFRRLYRLPTLSKAPESVNLSRST